MNLRHPENNLSIRAVRPDDYEGVVTLYNHLHADEVVIAENDQVKEMWQRILTNQDVYCFVAEKNSILISTCLLAILPNLTRSARSFGVLQNVVTHKDYIGQGVGRVLLQHALDFAWSLDCYQVLVQTGKEKAIAFYEDKLGFRQEKIGLVARPPA